MKDRDQLLKMRENIFKVFNPRIGEGTLTYSNSINNSYSIKCTVAKGPNEILSSGFRNSGMQAFSLSLLCASPCLGKATRKLSGGDDRLHRRSGVWRRGNI